MAYAVDRGSRPFVGSGGVIAVHAALAYLLVFGLAAPPFIPTVDDDLTTYPIPPEPEAPPPEEKPRDEQTAQPESTVTTPEDPFELPTTNTTTTEITDTRLPPVGEVVIPTIGGGGGEAIEVELFTPTLARPINNVLGWVTTADYPRIAIRREEQGITRFSVTVDAKGNVTNCRVVRSSGSTALDDATCKHVTKRAKFEPATDKYGAKVPGTYSHSVNWVLPE